MAAVISFWGRTFLSAARRALSWWPPAVGPFRLHLDFIAEVTLFPWLNTAEVWPFLPKAGFLKGSLFPQISAKTWPDMQRGLRLFLSPPALAPPLQVSDWPQSHKGIPPDRSPPTFIFHRHVPPVNFPYSYGKQQARQTQFVQEKKKFARKKKRGIYGLKNIKNPATNCKMDLISPCWFLLREEQSGDNEHWLDI